jgi:hypothetical protein
VYLREDNDVQRLVTSLFKSTTPKGAQTQDPFWDTAASMLLLALMFYLKYEAPPDEQNFPMVMEMLRSGEVREDEDGFQSPLDELFDRLEMRCPEHIAVKYYRDYRSGSAKTLKSIQITLAARLEKFNLDALAALTFTDELDLESIGEKKTALFIIIPDNDTSFNFLVSILYTQLFQALFYSADHKHGGSLPIHVHFLMDEFANVSLPDDLFFMSPHIARCEKNALNCWNILKPFVLQRSTDFIGTDVNAAKAEKNKGMAQGQSLNAAFNGQSAAKPERGSSTTILYGVGSSEPKQCAPALAG